MDKLVVKLNFKRGLRSGKTQEAPPDETRLKKDPTGAKRQKRFRKKWKKDTVKKHKNFNWCADYRKEIKDKRKNDSQFDELMKKRESERKARYRKKQKEIKAQTEVETPTRSDNSLKKTIKSLQKVKRNLNKKVETLRCAQKAHTPTNP